MSSTTSVNISSNTSISLSMISMGILFFIFGFTTWINGPLIVFVKLAFHLDDISAFLIPMVFYISYFFLALPSAFILKRTGMKKGMGLGLSVMAAGSVLFAHFIDALDYPGSLGGLFIIGSGLVLLQTAANPYIVILGPFESAAKRIAFMGVCNKSGGFLAPIVFGLLILHNITAFPARLKAAPNPTVAAAMIHQFAARLYWPYMGMAALLLAMAIYLLCSSLPDINAAQANPESAHGGHDQHRIFDFPHLWLGILCLFLYVGMEVMSGDAIVSYGQTSGIPLDTAKLLTSITMAGLVAGQLLGMFLVPRYISQTRYLSWSAVLSLLITIVIYLTQGQISAFLIAALGFSGSMMWPSFFPLAVKGLGRHTELGSALMIMGIAGGALIPQLYVHLKTVVDFQLAFFLIATPSYLYILYYSLRGHTVNMRMR